MNLIEFLLLNGSVEFVAVICEKFKKDIEPFQHYSHQTDFEDKDKLLKILLIQQVINNNLKKKDKKQNNKEINFQVKVIWDFKIKKKNNKNPIKKIMILMILILLIKHYKKRQGLLWKVLIKYKKKKKKINQIQIYQIQVLKKSNLNKRKNNSSRKKKLIFCNQKLRQIQNLKQNLNYNIMSEELILKIFKNYDKAFQEYKKDKTGLFAQYFDQKGIKDVKYLKHAAKKKDDKDAEGFGQKRGSKCEGVCIIKFGTKNYYIGDYKDNHKQGHGYHHFENGLVYRGKYEQDKKVDGEVFEPNSGKIVYQGGWGFDTYHGYGKFDRINNQYYHGEFSKGKFHGKGKLGWPNGDYYEGDMVNGLREGHGVFHFNNGDKYEGNFSRNKFNGKGVYSWANGDYYDGEFVDGKISGNGDMNFNIGVVCSGLWDNNKTTKVDFDPNRVPDELQYEYNH